MTEFRAWVSKFLAYLPRWQHVRHAVICRRKLAPPRVRDHYEYWADPPPRISDRCTYWLRRIEAGWRPGRFIGRGGYDWTAEYLGVWLWEYLHLISPVLCGRSFVFGDWTVDADGTPRAIGKAAIA